MGLYPFSIHTKTTSKMLINRINQELESLSDEELNEVLDFIISLKNRISGNEKRTPRFGWGKVKIEMAPDFDAP